MELLVNDLSIHGQFQDIESFVKAIDLLIGMRNLCKKFSFELYCHKNLANAQVINSMTMPKAIQCFEKPKRKAMMLWLSKGPYWEDNREHLSDDYFECNGKVVTDSAVGEAAYRCFMAVNCQLVSIAPSDWVESPLTVLWRDHGDEDSDVQVINHLDKSALEKELRAAPAPIESWEQLKTFCCTRFTNLRFSKDAFSSLSGHPFVPGAVRRIIERLDVLDRLKTCVDSDGKRTPEGNKIYQDHFTGDKAWFSDSSDHEKIKFKKDLTFNFPDNEGETLFCPMHGKVKTPQIRIHFSWPVTVYPHLYVVYVGYKITKV